MSQTEKEEPYISDAFYKEIEKHAKLDGLSVKEFMEQAAKSFLERLKQIYPDSDKKERKK